MCCFSKTIQLVANTNIFARSKADGRQILVYQMRYESEDDVAMILPLPTPKNSKETAVKFINLEEYGEFFGDLGRGFDPEWVAGRRSGSGSFGGKPKLKVVDVGNFEASFVPTVGDFQRLDERFRLPEETWTKAVPRYRDWGFAVFKLKSGKRDPHPMAFSFPRRDPRQIFFPTMHIHDGEVHEQAEFDHVLYCQLAEGERRDRNDWDESPQPAARFMNVKKDEGTVDGGLHVYKKAITGEQENDDVLV